MWRKIVIWGIVAAGVVGAIITYPKMKEARNAHSSVRTSIELPKPFVENSLGKYRIKVSKGQTEIEKTGIVKYNNLLDCLEELIAKFGRGEEITSKEERHAQSLFSDFTGYFVMFEKSMRAELVAEMEQGFEALGAVTEKLSANNMQPTSATDRRNEPVYYLVFG